MLVYYFFILQFISKFREVNDDILKEWFDFRDESLGRFTSEEDQKHSINFEDIAKNILRNVPEQNKKYVKKQLDLLDENYLDYIFYWDEKYYRNGFVDGVKMVIGCTME